MTQPKDTQNEAKQRVLAVYPDARFCPSYLDCGAIITGTIGNHGYLNNGWNFTETAAWKDAASKLTPTAIGFSVSAIFTPTTAPIVAPYPVVTLENLVITGDE